MTKVVAPTQAILVGNSFKVPHSSGLSQKDNNTNDPVEVALAGRLHNSALAHVATSTSKHTLAIGMLLFCGVVL